MPQAGWVSLAPHPALGAPRTVPTPEPALEQTKEQVMLDRKAGLWGGWPFLPTLPSPWVSLGSPPLTFSPGPRLRGVPGQLCQWPLSKRWDLPLPGGRGCRLHVSCLQGLDPGGWGAYGAQHPNFGALLLQMEWPASPDPKALCSGRR